MPAQPACILYTLRAIISKHKNTPAGYGSAYAFRISYSVYQQAAEQYKMRRQAPLLRPKQLFAEVAFKRFSNVPAKRLDRIAHKLRLFARKAAFSCTYGTFAARSCRKRPAAAMPLLHFKQFP